MKVALIVNSTIGPKIKSGPGKEGYEIARGLLRAGILGHVYCYSASDDCEIPSDYIVPFCKSRFKRKLLGMIDRLHKRNPAIRGRRRTEEWMDRTYARKLKPETAGILYSPKPIYPLAFKRARELGITTLVETSVLHPRFNLEVVAEEIKRLGLRGASGYTDKRRVENIEQALLFADFIFAWSAFVKSSYIRYGVPEEKFLSNEMFSPPGVDTDRYIPAKKSNSDFVVLHISSISIIKGVQHLLEAWTRIADGISGRLLMVGPIDRNILQIVSKYMRDDIEWLGVTDDPVSYYQTASVFVSSSLSDAGPRTVLEAMACEVPAIVSTSCGVAELIDQGINGLVYKYDDIDTLAGHLQWCFYNRDMLRKMGQEARKKVMAFRIEDYFDNVLLRIKQVSARNGIE